MSEKSNLMEPAASPPSREIMKEKSSSELKGETYESEMQSGGSHSELRSFSSVGAMPPGVIRMKSDRGLDVDGLVRSRHLQ